jgi:hypothetical protein
VWECFGAGLYSCDERPPVSWAQWSAAGSHSLWASGCHGDSWRTPLCPPTKDRWSCLFWGVKLSNNGNLQSEAIPDWSFCPMFLPSVSSVDRHLWLELDQKISNVNYFITFMYYTWSTKPLGPYSGSASGPWIQPFIIINKHLLRRSHISKALHTTIHYSFLMGKRLMEKHWDSTQPPAG